MSNGTYIARATLLFIVFLAFGLQASGQKDDTLYFLNGDRISGEIKQYKYGHLNYKTYGVSTVNVKYDKISTFFSRKSFDILMENGIRRFGSFDTSNLVQFVKIITTNDTVLTPLIEIVEITPIKKRFWGRMSGSVDLGFSYTKANTLSQLSFNTNMKYTQRNYLAVLKVNSINSVQQYVENSRTRKNDVELSYFHRIKNNWLFSGTGSVEQNSELGLDLRAQGGLGIGNELIHTNSNNLLALAGAVVNREWYNDTTLVRTNFDALFALQYRLFRFSRPEIDITSNGAVYRGLNVTDRWRINYDIKLKFKIITDMFLSLSFYTNYDSRPPSATSSNLDYSFTTSFGYSF